MAASLQATPQKADVKIDMREGKKGEESGHATIEYLIEEEEGGEDGNRFRMNGGPLIWINVNIGEDLRVEAIIDSGATYSCVDSELYDKLLEEGAIKGELPVHNVKLVIAVGKRRVEIKKQVVVEIIWARRKYRVLTLVVKGLFTSLVLGLNWLRGNRVIIDCEKNQIKIEGGSRGSNRKKK